MQEQLTDQVRSFADDLTRLLNLTVTHGIRISSAQVDSNKFRIGCGITAKNPLRPKLHFPVGGARHDGGIHYRPILEDIVEMLVSERLVESRENWKQAVATGRKKYYESQLRAAIRRSPEIAQDALDGLAN